MKNKQKLIITVLTLLMVFATVSSAYANSMTFADMDEVPWAKTHIQRMVDKKIISGYVDDRTLELVFRPANPVTKLEAMQLVYKVLQQTGKLQSTNNYTAKYRTLLDDNNIPWGEAAVAYALEYKIIGNSELASFISNGNQTNATRQEIAMYYGRAMANPSDLRQSPSLNFIDREMISQLALPYVGYLVEESVISGDNNNRFNPTSTITRAEMAALSSKAYDMLERKPDYVIDISNPNIEEEEEEEAETKKMTRTIEQVDTRGYVLFVYDDNDRLEMYEIEEDAEVLISDRQQTLSRLTKGQVAELTFEDEKLVKIEVDAKRSRFDGPIRSINELDEYHLISVEGMNNSSDRRNFRVNNQTEIIIGGKKASINDLERWDEITVYHDGLYATKIEAYDSVVMKEVTGILASNISFRNYPFKMEVRGLNNRVETYEVGYDVTVRINDRRAELEDLVQGDIVFLEIEDDKVIRIEATSTNRKRTETGTLKSITLGNPNTMVIINEDNEELTYNVGNSVLVYIDNNKAQLYDLRTNYELEVEIQGDSIVGIEAKSRTQRNVIEGEITRFYDSIDRMIVRHISSSTGRSEETSIYVTRDTVIIDVDGKTTNMGMLRRGDEVFINGSYEDDIFVANRIIVLND